MDNHYNLRIFPGNLTLCTKLFYHTSQVTGNLKKNLSPPPPHIFTKTQTMLHLSRGLFEDTTQLEVVMDKVMQKSMELTPCEFCSVLLLDKDMGQVSWVKFKLGGNRDYIRGKNDVRCIRWNREMVPFCYLNAGQLDYCSHTIIVLSWGPHTANLNLTSGGNLKI